MLEESFRTYVRLLRLENCLIAFVAVLVSIHLTRSNIFSLQTTIASVSAFIIMAGGNVINNYFDRDKDKKNPNKQQRNPLASGDISEKRGLQISISLFLVGNLVSWLSFSSWTIVIATFATFALTMYTWVKHKGFLKGAASNLIIALLIGLLYIYGWSVFSNVLNQTVFLSLISVAFFSFLTTIVREIVKGVADYEGDLKTKIKTLATSYTPKIAIQVATIILVGIILLSPLPYLLAVMSSSYVPLVILTDAILISALIVLWFNTSEDTAKAMKDRIRVGMIVGLVAFFLGGSLTTEKTTLIVTIGDKLIGTVTNDFVVSVFNTIQVFILVATSIASLIISHRLRVKYSASREKIDVQ